MSDPTQGAPIVVHADKSASVEPTLAEMMSRVGQRLSFASALAICSLSVVLLAIVLIFGASHWRIALLLVACGSFGAWTVADHERRDLGGSMATRWKVLQGASGVLGVAALFVLFLSYLATVIGLWIS